MSALKVFQAKGGVWGVESGSEAVLDHLRQRHLDVDRYSLWFGEDDTVHFPFWTPTGKLVGYQRYRFRESKNGLYATDKMRKYYNYYMSGECGFWGVESLDYRSDILFVVEGVFDAVRLHNLNLPAVSVHTYNPKPLHDWLWLMQATRKIVCVMDPDSDVPLYPNADVYEWRVGTDLGDASESDVLALACAALCGAVHSPLCRSESERVLGLPSKSERIRTYPRHPHDRI